MTSSFDSVYKAAKSAYKSFKSFFEEEKKQETIEKDRFKYIKKVLSNKKKPKKKKSDLDLLSDEKNKNFTLHTISGSTKDPFDPNYIISQVVKGMTPL